MEPEAEAAERATTDRVRDLRKRIAGIGKRTTEDVFDLGEAFEEAASLLRGRFSAWVVHECRIEPRTVLGYRRVFTVLGSRRDTLRDRAIAPSVLVRLAFAPKEVRERGLGMIDGGRDLRLADLKALSPRERGPAGAELRSALAAGAVRLSSDLQALAATLGRDRADMATTAAQAAESVMPAVAALLPGTPLSAALEAFATDPNKSTARTLADAIREFGREPAQPGGPAAAPADPAPVAVPARPETAAERNATRFEKSAFRHGLTAVEICAGSGGQAYGLARAGFRHAALVEWDEDACDTLRAAFPSAAVIEGDLRTVDLDRHAGVDLFAGGPPCVSYSQGGKRKGGNDRRDLMPRAVELIERLRPRAVLLENVMGIFERGVDQHRLDILTKLANAGYRCEWREVRAFDFGIAQARRRAVLVGFREPEAMARFSWPAPASASADEVYSVSSALMHHFTAEGWEPEEDLLRQLDALAPTIVGGSPTKQGVDLGRENTRAAWRRIGIDPTGIVDRVPAASHWGPPMLTIAMLATLQGFPMDWPFKGGRTPHFKQIANALPPVVAMHLGCSVAAALTGEAQDHRRETMRLAMSRRLSPAAARTRTAPSVAEEESSSPIGAIPGTGTRRLDLRKLASVAMDHDDGPLIHDPTVDGRTGWTDVPA